MYYHWHLDLFLPSFYVAINAKLVKIVCCNLLQYSLVRFVSTACSIGPLAKAKLYILFVTPASVWQSQVTRTMLVRFLAVPQ